MSDANIIVADLNALIDSVNKLLKEKTTQEIPNIARDLGFVPQLNTTLDLVGKGLGGIEQGVDLMARHIAQIDSAVAGFEIIAASIKDFGKGEALVEISTNLGISADFFQTASSKVEKVGTCLKSALGITDALPAPETINELPTQLNELSKTVAGLKAPVLPAK